MKKSYEFSSIGYAEFTHDLRVKKQKRLNLVISTSILLGLMTFGILSKEILLIYGVNTGINIVTDIIL